MSDDSNAAHRIFDIDTGRKSPGSYQLKKMKAVHRRIAEHAALGLPDKDIATLVGVSPKTVSYTRNSKVVQDYMDILEKAAQGQTVDTLTELRELAPFAARTLEVLMLNPNTDDKIRASVAQDLLDRAGYAPVKKVATAHMNVLDTKDIAEIKQRAREAGVMLKSPEPDASTVQELDIESESEDERS